jgi:hypothetical protein
MVYRSVSKVKCFLLQFMIESAFEHNPRAMSTVEPETKVSFNEFQKNIKEQLKKQYDTKRSN